MWTIRNAIRAALGSEACGRCWASRSPLLRARQTHVRALNLCMHIVLQRGQGLFGVFSRSVDSPLRAGTAKAGT